MKNLFMNSRHTFRPCLSLAAAAASAAVSSVQAASKTGTTAITGATASPVAWGIPHASPAAPAVATS